MGLSGRLIGFGFCKDELSSVNSSVSILFNSHNQKTAILDSFIGQGMRTRAEKANTLVPKCSPVRPKSAKAIRRFHAGQRPLNSDFDYCYPSWVMPKTGLLTTFLSKYEHFRWRRFIFCRFRHTYSIANLIT